MRVNYIGIENKKIVGLQIVEGTEKASVYEFGKIPSENKSVEGKAQKEATRPGFNHTGRAILGAPADENNCLFAINECIKQDYPDTYGMMTNLGINLVKVAKAYGVELWELSIDDIKDAIEQKLAKES